MLTDRDYALALQLQEQFNEENDVNRRPVVERTPRKSKENTFSNLASPSLEVKDPNPDVHALFMQFNQKFFWNRLGQVVVRWSKRMYSCAGICRFQSRIGFCDIALSEPLLKLRPRKDLVETLLHEMIHAYLFLTANYRDREDHGPNFHEHMYRINRAANVNITVFHSFHDEVQLYKTHWWKCNGPCQRRPPFFGIVRRTCNRAPGPNDLWWNDHRIMCSGSFIKIKEPEKKAKGKQPQAKKTPANNLQKFFPPVNANPTGILKPNNSVSSINTPNRYPNLPIQTSTPKTNNISPYSSDTKESLINLTRIGGPITNLPSSSFDIKETVRSFWANKYPVNNKRKCDVEQIDGSPSKKVLKKESPRDSTNECFNLPNETEIVKKENEFCDTKLFKSEVEEYDNKSFVNSSNVVNALVDNFPDRKGNVTSILTINLSRRVIRESNKIMQQLYGSDFRLEPHNFKTRYLKKTKVIEKINLVQTNCPICDKLFTEHALQAHIEECVSYEEFENNDYKNESIDLTDCFNGDDFNEPSCSTSTGSATNSSDDKSNTRFEEFNNLPSCSRTNRNNFEENDDDSPFKSFDDTQSVTIKTKNSTVYYPCPVCNEKLECGGVSDEHLEKCLSSVTKRQSGEMNDVSFDKKDDSGNSYEPCPVCETQIPSDKRQEHLDMCVSDILTQDCGDLSNNESFKSDSMQFDAVSAFPERKSLNESVASSSVVENFDDFEPKGNSTIKKEVDSSILLKVNISTVDEVLTLSDDEDTIVPESTSTNKVECPCCQLLIEHSQLNSHLDDCLIMD